MDEEPGKLTGHRGKTTAIVSTLNEDRSYWPISCP